MRFPSTRVHFTPYLPGHVVRAVQAQCADRTHSMADIAPCSCDYGFDGELRVLDPPCDIDEALMLLRALHTSVLGCDLGQSSPPLRVRSTASRTPSALRRLAALPVCRNWASALPGGAVRAWLGIRWGIGRRRSLILYYNVAYIIVFCLTETVNISLFLNYDNPRPSPWSIST